MAQVTKAGGDNGLTCDDDCPYHTAIGNFAMNNVTGGSYSTALGQGALRYGARLPNLFDCNWRRSSCSRYWSRQCCSRSLLKHYERGSGSYSVAVGNYALYEPDSGAYNVAIGYQAQRESTGSNNVSLGYEAGYKVPAQRMLVWFGYQAGRVFTGDSSVGVERYYALRLLESGEDNTGIGFRALGNNLTNASDNTALGANAGYYVGGSQKYRYWLWRLCMAQRPIPAAETQQLATDLYSVIHQDTITSQLSWQSMVDNTTGTGNVALGMSALQYNTSGNDNVAIGQRALDSNSTGGLNTALGYFAGTANTTGSNNVFIGNAAGNNNSGGHTGHIW